MGNVDAFGDLCNEAQLSENIEASCREHEAEAEPRSKRVEVLVLGDSHADVFNHACIDSLFPEHFFTVVSVAGATVSGLENPNSVTQALPVFRNSMKTSRASVVLVLLGEVDVGFVLWYRSEKYAVPMQAMLGQALQRYQTLLLELAERFHVICISAPLPTISDNNEWGDVANKRKEVKATQVERTRLTLRFNSAMQTFCNDQVIGYAMLDMDSMGNDEVVRECLLNENPLDHHYSPLTYAHMLAEKLNPILLSGDCGPTREGLPTRAFEEGLP